MPIYNDEYRHHPGDMHSNVGIGPRGAKGDKGDKGDTGNTGATGPRGPKGDAFTFQDFTQQQLDDLRSDVSSVYYRMDEMGVVNHGSMSTIILPSSFYTPGIDMIIVDIEGLVLSNGVDYTINGNVITLATPVTHSDARVHIKRLTALALTTEFSELTNAIDDATTAAGAANIAAGAANASARAADIAREGIQTDLAAKADKTGTYSTLISGGTTPDTVTDAMLKQTGGVLEQVSDLKSELAKLMTSEDKTDNYTSGGYIAIKGMVGQTIDITDITASSSRAYVVVPCAKGDVFKLTGAGGDNPRLYGFLDSNYVCLSVSSSEITVTDLILTANQDGYFVSNVYSGGTYSLIHYYYTLEDTYAKKDAVADISQRVNAKINANAYNYGFAYDLNSEPLWEQGTISTTNGNNSDSQTRIRTKTYIDSSVEKIVTPIGYMNVYTYSSAGTYEGYSGWIQEYDNFDSTKKYRVIYSTVAGSSGASNVTPSTDWNKFIFLNTALYSHKFRKKIAWAGSIPFEWYSGKGSGYSLFTRETSYSDYISAFHNLVDDSDYVTETLIGTSSDGQTLYKYELIPTMYRNITITNYNKPPKVIVISGQHGFEKSSCYGLYYLVRDLLNNYADSEALTWIKSNLHLIIIPVANPYGFDNLTRKNANDVDLNRNWNPGWEEGDPSDSDYGGASAFDQPETQAIKAVVDANTDALYLIDFHTNGMGRAEAWNKVNWNTFNVDVFEDDYYINAYYAVNTHITQLTENMLSEYSLDSDGEPLGSVETNQRGATVSTYAKSVGVMANTFEGTNGFPSESAPYSANEQKANSEMIGNWIKTLMATFRALN